VSLRGPGFTVISEYIPGPRLLLLKHSPGEIVFLAGQHREAEMTSNPRLARAAKGNKNRVRKKRARPRRRVQAG
jgi:hypothetical protein